GTRPAESPGRDLSAQERPRRGGCAVREPRRGPPFNPGPAGSVGRRMAFRINSYTALDQTTDPRALMRVQERAATRRKRDAVVTHEDVARGKRDLAGELLDRRTVWPLEHRRLGLSRRKLPSPWCGSA